jgi:hypothetical protein
MDKTNKKIKKMRKFAYLFLSLLILFTVNAEAQDERRKGKTQASKKGI